MSATVRILEAALPAMASFGPLFLVAEPRRPQWAKGVRYTGVLMVTGALLMMWTIITAQKAGLSILELRVQALESRTK